MKKTILTAALLALSGCAGMQQAVTGYESAALAGARASNDNLIAVWSVAACATPISAAMRHPEIIAGLKALCMPGGEVAPITLLDSIEARNRAAPAAAAPAAPVQ